MKRIFTLLLALVMVLSLAAPALAAEDVFEVPETEVTAEAPEAPVEEAPAEEAPVEEVPAEAPDMPQAAAVEPEDAAPEDTETAPDDAQTGKLTILGEVDKLWYVQVENEAGETSYVGDYDDITIQDGDTVYLFMDYRYTIQVDKDWQLYDEYGVLVDETPEGAHAGDVTHGVAFDVSAEGGYDVTVTIVEDPNAPQAIPVTWTAPEGVTVKTNDFILLVPYYYGVFTCDAGYVPVFTGAEPRGFRAMEDGTVKTYFMPYEDTQSIQVDVKKATGSLNITGLEEGLVRAFLGNEAGAYANAELGLVGGMYLTVGLELGYDVQADVEPIHETYGSYNGVDVHVYYFAPLDSGDVNMEIVKTPLPVDPPKAGTGWACDETTGDYYYFVDGAQKFNYWAASERGLWYYIGPDGKMATGFQYVQNRNGTGWYMFQTDNKDGCIGRMLTGWQWTWSLAGTGWFNTAHGGVNGQCTYSTAWGAYNAATGLWADGQYHHNAL